MIRTFPPRVLVAIIFFILLANAAVLYWDLLFYIWWLDIPLHVLGGLWITLFVLSSYYSFFHAVGKEHSPVFVFSFAVALTLSVGLFWEIYEFAVDHAVGDSGVGLADTLKDLVDDLIGAMIGALIFIRGNYHGTYGP
ncbi:MAG: hypothetical protein A3D65_03670 [Candidatus Lloydbacteria bacterium RIFCSPHIGHO2_02_FULL_50_13]|uniref:VanZ-like domain-containing protein n=1 Tax=Candidatus Lloydbacteria bacterium RIFCSPHIGHO2_02_FULL_50_13 TaxID=1798661 RepID=A0A1G2D2G4_9BACT|nr:MAG: hypothetical protein A3D65_03670 [Candidatus Lloydbacteria bacterium RIFCSPHIGHO2_02_FULL_50_13]